LIAQAASTQNVGKPPPKPWGAGKGSGSNGNGGGGGRRRRSGKGKGNGVYSLLACLDATNPKHLPLPRAVGNYQVIRTTQVVDLARISSDAAIPIPQFAFFAPIASQSFAATEDTRWVAACGILSAGTAVNSALGSYLVPMSGLDALELATTAVPSAVTIQVMNPDPLNSASGIAYLGKSSAQYDLAGSSRDWTQLGNEFVQFMTPRLCAAGKLCIRGTKYSAYPLDMSDLSDFRPIRSWNDLVGSTSGKFTWGSDIIKPEGFSPLVIYNPNSIPLQILVTMEWRVRFDPGNPAAASHRYHGVASDSTWGKVTAAATAMGHGVVDMAEDGAEGAAAAAGAISAAARMAPFFA
jgi:hypothetical protein